MKKLRFLVSLHTRENDFQVAQGQSAEDAARKLRSDVEIVFADNDAVNQSTQLLKAIQGRVESRPDAIVVEPVGSTAITKTTAKMVEDQEPRLFSGRRPTRVTDSTLRAASHAKTYNR